MKERSPVELNELASDLEAELASLRRLEVEIERVLNELRADPARADLFRENLAFKLHNFYTGCEHLFQIVASELNGALPTGYDWHKRLLERMALPRDDRPALLSEDSAHALQEYLAFRHVIRNTYGFELNPERVDQLVAHYPSVWKRVEADVTRFVGWLRSLAAQLDEGT